MKIHNNNYLYDCYAWTALSRNNYNVTITDWKFLEYAWYCLKKKESQIQSCPLCGNFVWSINYMYAVVDDILLYHFNLILKATQIKNTYIPKAQMIKTFDSNVVFDVLCGHWFL